MALAEKLELVDSVTRKEQCVGYKHQCLKWPRQRNELFAIRKNYPPLAIPHLFKNKK